MRGHGKGIYDENPPKHTNFKGEKGLGFGKKVNRRRKKRGRKVK